MLRVLSLFIFCYLGLLGPVAAVEETAVEPELVNPDPVETEVAVDEAAAAGELTDDEKARMEDAHVISQSRVFSVSGSDGLRVGAIAARADDVRAQLCRLLDISQKKHFNISLRLVGMTSDTRVYPRMKQQIDLIGTVPSLTLFIQAGGGVDVEELTKQIISISLYEYALRDVNVEAIEGSITIPHWLLTGIQQAVLLRNDKIDRDIYQQLFDRAEMLSPEQIISNKKPWELDAASRQVYETSCGVLILGLLSQNGGDVRVRDMLRESMLQEGDLLSILQQHFHEVGLSANALAKWWALELANLAVPKTTETMTPLETEERLVDALRITAMNTEEGVPEQISLDDAYRIVQMDDWKTQLLPIPHALSAMSVRCFPTYRPFILEYIRAINLLLKNGDPDEVQNIIGPIRELREAYVIAAIRVRDYLDWYEITHTGRSNQAAFTSYLDTMAMLRHEQTTADTAISRYLQDIEELFKLPTDKPLPKRMREELKTSTTQP